MAKQVPIYCSPFMHNVGWIFFNKPDALSLKVGKAAPEADLQTRFRLVTREKSFKIDAVSDRARTP